MSSPVTSAQAAQAGLVLAMAPDLQAAFGKLDVSQLKESLPAYKLLVAALARKYGAASATMAARFYGAQRSIAGVGSRFSPTPAPAAPVAQVGQAIDWATQPLWAAEPDLATAQTNIQGAVEKLVLDAGRDTIISNAHRDPHAKGWARIPEPGACYFCALLATRGDVYKAQKQAGFKSHDHCRCHAEPIFTAYEPSAQVRQWRADYAKATRSVSGSKAKQLAWRHAFTAPPS